MTYLILNPAFERWKKMNYSFSTFCNVTFQSSSMLSYSISFIQPRSQMYFSHHLSRKTSIDYITHKTLHERIYSKKIVSTAAFMLLSYMQIMKEVSLWYRLVDLMFFCLLICKDYLPTGHNWVSKLLAHHTAFRWRLA